MAYGDKMETSADYIKWNNRLAKFFFNEEMAGREVLLYVNRQIIHSIGEGLGDVEHFINSVKIGPPWVTRSGLCQKALQAYEGWRNMDDTYPPYIAFLVLFVLAEDIEGDFAPNSYYPKLNKLLGLPQEQNSPPSFYRMSELWADLQKWSREDRHEELGRFVFRIRGEWRHVGLPLSQTLLSHNERENLKVIFDRADLDPTDAPAVDIMNRLLLRYGTRLHLLQNRTLDVLVSPIAQDIVLKNALLEFIYEELADWDGTTPSTDKATVKESRTGLRICIHEDILSKKMEAYFRFKTNRKMPEAELNFIWAIGNKTLTCFESNANWSSPLKEQPSSRIFNASSISWTEAFELKDLENNWQAKLHGAHIRVFIPGKNEGLPDWIESHHLERQTEFLVAANSDEVGKITAWGSGHCERFYEKSHDGLPPGWSMYFGKNATNSCAGVDSLTLSDLVQMKIIGGIKIGRGNTYLKFGLPRIILTNVTGLEKIKINGSEIERIDPNVQLWELPKELELHTPLRIEVYSDTSPDPIQTRIISLEEPCLPDSFNEVPHRAKDGEIIRIDVTNYAVGSIVIDVNKIEYGSSSNILPTHLSSRIIFLGSKPGEIIDWPSETLPEGWDPVWAIQQIDSKQWAASFCGRAKHLEVNHCPGKPVSDHRAVKRWKEAIWVNRRITRPPSLPFLAKIWNRYKEAAKNA
jgi:hypothetical protein